MGDKEQKEFLQNSGYRTIRKQMLCSCNLKTFYEYIESKLPSAGFQSQAPTPKEGEAPIEVKTYNTDKEFVDDFVSILKDELVDVIQLFVIKIYNSLRIV